MTLHRLILNADDFGRSSVINNAVLRSFGQGYCTNTTILANMPGFAEAVELAHQYRLSDRVGLHLNVCDGVPLTERIKHCRRICTIEGVFRNDNRPLLLTLSTEERMALAEEICAQIDCCRKSGLPLSHLDSHCHVHNEWGVTGVVIRMVRRYGIRYVRLSRHRDPSSTWWKNGYRAFINMRLRREGLAGTDFFGTVADAIHLHNQVKNPFAMEVMLHPTLDANDRVVDFFLDGTLKERLEELQKATSHIPYELDSYKLPPTFR